MPSNELAMSGLSDDVKRDLKSIVLELRHLFEEDLSLGLKRLGIDVGKGEVVDADSETLSYLTAGERRVRAALDAVLAKEASMTKDVPEALRALLRESAYTHLNRLIGLKCLELRGHLVIDGERTEVVTPRADYGDLPKYLWKLRPSDARYLADPEALWHDGLLRACAAASAELGVLFDPADPYAQVWPSQAALDRAVSSLGELPESAFAADELLGWVYQYFQSEEKDRVFEEVRIKKKKIAWADIVPVTQLYTERYMVDFLLQNSIGVRWMEMYPHSPAKEVWAYYMESATPRTRQPEPLKNWRILDPCCGSGHFLVVAFDLLAQLYEEERKLAESGAVPADWATASSEVARAILERNLYGVDIDPRAVQLSALALYLKGKERGLASAPEMNLVIADCVLQRGYHYQALLDAYKDDSAAVEAIEAIWTALENVRDLGSLVRIEEEVEAAVVKARERVAGSFEDLSTDWDAYRVRLIDRLESAFRAEASTGDERQRVFGAEAGKGIKLLQVLSDHYDVVCTNPPYMGSGGMGSVLSKYLGDAYPAGKHDLYSAFILRCLSLSRSAGHIAMVTQQSWMFLRKFEGMRALADSGSRSGRGFGGLLVDASVRVLGHLGPGAFGEVGGEVVSVVLTVAENLPAENEGRFVALRAVGAQQPDGKARLLRDCAGGYRKGATFCPSYADLRSLPLAPMAYWLGDSAIAALRGDVVGDAAQVVRQVITGDNDRFVRFQWEVSLTSGPWVPYLRGGGRDRWAGHETSVFDWHPDGQRLKAAISEKYPYLRGNTNWLVKEDTFFKPGWVYSRMARGTLAVRANDGTAVCDNSSPAIVPMASDRVVGAVLNSRVLSYFLRAICPDLTPNESYIGRLPLPACSSLRQLEQTAVALKRRIVADSPTERLFKRTDLPGRTSDSSLAVQAQLLTIEGLLERHVCTELGLTPSEIERAHGETDPPVAYYSLVDEYDALPEPLPSDSSVQREMLDGLSGHGRISPIPARLEGIRSRLRSLYAAGPNTSSPKSILEDDEPADDEFATADARIPIPPETFLEELSRDLRLHPVSVYWLLRELIEDEGLVCPPEIKRQAEDWVSVELLLMLGHRWPAQDEYEAREAAPFLDSEWLDPDGIIPMTDGLGEETLAERFRRHLDREFGSDKGHAVEVELASALGWKPGLEWGTQSPVELQRWFGREFFKRHVTQFKRRPIAWHLRSPKGTINVMVYYHAFTRDRLALLRARYLGGLRQDLVAALAAARESGYDDRANVGRIENLEDLLADLESFDTRLAKLQEGRDRDARIWCPWKKPSEQPQGWDPDINDGVRVNIAPVQRLGLLAANVLNKKDLDSLLAPEGRA